LLAFQVGPGIVGNPSVLQNVGAVHTYGAEATATYRILPALSLFGSYSFNHSDYADNVVNAAGQLLVATKGMTVVDSPRHMAKGELVYDDGTYMARVGADYMTKRYFTYLNDESVPGRVLVDASIGYTFHGSGLTDGLNIQANVTNLTNKKYIATVGSNGFTASGDNQTLLAGAPRQWFVSLRKSF
jgi:iron complex outermembrane receptor protein